MFYLVLNLTTDTVLGKAQNFDAVFMESFEFAKENNVRAEMTK